MEEVSISMFFNSSKAYLIAVSDYDSVNIDNLVSPVADVNAVKHVLEERHGFLADPIGGYPNPLINPKGPDILKFISGIQVGEDDRVLFYFAGHGIAHNSDGNPEGFLLPAEAVYGEPGTFVRMKDVMDALDALPCRHLLIVLDCCYAGAFRWAESSRGFGSDEIPKTIYYERFEQYATSKAWQVLTSSAHDQKAVDVLNLLGKREDQDAGLGRLSPFAEKLVGALESGAADLSYGATPPDGIITVTELSFYLGQEIFRSLYEAGISVEKRQIPMLFSLKKHNKGQFMFLNPRAGTGGKAQLQHKISRNPYKGLEAYTIDDSLLFYGRSRVIKDGWFVDGTLYISLEAAIAAHSMVIVTGPSGIGKSSLVKAGILSVFKSANKTVNEIRPGKTPYQTYKALLTDIEQRSDQTILLVDQYEELISICESETERSAFQACLCRIVDKHKVIITIRSDFEVHFKEHPLFTDKQRHYRFTVPPFLREEIHDIVLQPAAQQVLEFKSISGRAEDNERFVNKIIDDCFQNPGSLPLLSFALSDLYKKREDVNLLEKVYHDAGGMNGILDRRIKEAYHEYEDSMQTLFRYLIFRMLSFEGGRIAKKRVFTKFSANGGTLSELSYPSEGTSQKVELIRKSLVDESRLLSTGTDENGNDYTEPSHDSLLRSSPLILGWLNEKQEGSTLTGQEKIILHKSVSDTAIDYYTEPKPKKKKGYLWKDDPRLALVRNEIDDQLNSIESEFIKESFNAKRVRTNWYIFTGVLFITLIAVGTFLIFRQAMKTLAEAKRTKALSYLTLSRNTEPTEAINIIKQAFYLDSTNANILSQVITLSEQARNRNRFIQKRLKFDDVTFELIYFSDSTYVASQAEGKLVIRLPGRTIRLKMGENGYPTIRWIPQKQCFAAYLSGSPLRILNLNGRVIDSVPIKDDPFNHVKFDVVNGAIYVLTDNYFLRRVNFHTDTLKVSDRRRFSSFCIGDDRIILTDRKGEIFSCGLELGQLKQVGKTEKDIKQIVGTPNGGFATLSDNGKIDVFSRNFKSYKSFHGHNIYSIRPFRKTPRLLIQPASGKDTATLWDYQNNSRTFLLQKKSWDKSDISPSERFILTCGDNEFNIWEPSGQKFFTYTTDQNSDESYVKFFDSDYQFIVLSSTSRRADFWNLKKVNDLFSFSFQCSPEAFMKRTSNTLQLNHQDMVAKVSNEISKYNLKFKKYSFRAAYGKGNGQFCIYADNGLLVVYKGSDKREFQLYARIDEVYYTKSSDSLIVKNDEGLLLIAPFSNPSNYKKLFQIDNVNSIKFNESTNTFCVKELMTGKVYLINLHGSKKNYGTINAEHWCLTADDSRLCFLQNDTIYLRSLLTGRTTKLRTPDHNFDDICISPDGTYLAYNSMQMNSHEAIKLFTLRDDRIDRQVNVYNYDSQDVRNVYIAFSRDEDYLIAGYDNQTLMNYLTPKGAAKWINQIKFLNLSQ